MYTREAAFSAAASEKRVKHRSDPAGTAELDPWQNAKRSDRVACCRIRAAAAPSTAWVDGYSADGGVGRSGVHIGSGLRVGIAVGFAFADSTLNPDNRAEPLEILGAIHLFTGRMDEAASLLSQAPGRQRQPHRHLPARLDEVLSGPATARRGAARDDDRH
jgi:hypothetical protein